PSATPGEREGGSSMPIAAIATPELARFLGATDADVAALASGKGIAFGPASYGPTANVRISTAHLVPEPPGFPSPAQLNGPERVRVDLSNPVDINSLVRRPKLAADAVPAVLIPRSALARFDHPVVSQGLLLQSARPLTASQRDALDNTLADVIDQSSGIGPRFFPGPPIIQWFHPASSIRTKLQAILAAAALLFTLAVVAVALALEGAESRGERDVLVAVGAPPRSVASLVAVKGATLAAVAMVLALPMGMAPFAVLARTSTPHRPIEIPYLVIGLLVFVAPVVVGITAFVTSSLTARLSPVTATRLSAD
ncbi:MAG: putative transport system permease protein, partial [Actinomycetota bacterium]|nr:putative transport system permease protein [Actinomycetota bacterium]